MEDIRQKVAEEIVDGWTLSEKTQFCIETLKELYKFDSESFDIDKTVLD